ncbi:hypothetical protein [Brevibacillus reuszeri]|uniref:hypothetical protein n=1 Tax=Brevibacillus reuszeri TaxID=54915 RepID=UPI003D23D284
MSVNKKKVTLYAVLSLGCAIAAGNLLFKYSEKQFIQEHYEEIIAIRPGKILNQYTPIVEGDLTIKSVQKSELIDGMMSSSNIPKMIGKMTWVPVANGEPLLDWKVVDDKKLFPNLDQARYEIPISDFTPMTEIRKGDFVKVWVRYSAKKQEQMIEQLGPPIEFKQTSGAASDFLFTSQVAGVKGSQGEEIFSMLAPIVESTQAVGEFIDNKPENSSDTQRRLQQTYRGAPTAIPSRMLFNWSDEQYKIFVEALKYGDVQIGVYMPQAEKITLGNSGKIEIVDIPFVPTIGETESAPAAAN